MGTTVWTLKAERKAKFRKKKRSQFRYTLNQRETKKIERIAIKTIKAKRPINDWANRCEREGVSRALKVYEATRKIISKKNITRAEK